jgi:predicted kinase
MLCGLTGSGKTTYGRLLEKRGIERLSIDETVFDRHGRYDIDDPHTDYRAHWEAARAELDLRLTELLERGESVVLDYGFWSRSDRNAYKQIVEDAGSSWRLLYFRADRDLLEQRLRHRNQRTDANALIVDSAMLDDFFARFEAPEDEGEEVIPQAQGGPTQ